MLRKATKARGGQARNPLPCPSKQGGFALILSLAVLMIVTLSIGLVEESFNRSLGLSREAIAKVRAEYACYGGAVRAAVNPPDSFSAYDYLGTRVEVTVSAPPVSLLEVMMAKAQTESATESSYEGNLRMLSAAVASHSATTSSEAVWHYLVIEKDRPRLWTAWPGYQ